MRYTSAALAGLLLLAACNANQTAATQAAIQNAAATSATVVNAAVVDGQLFCAKATQYGPIVVGIVNAIDAKAVTVTGQTSQWVASVCGVIGAIPVATPAAPAQAPVVAVVTPPVS